MYNIWGGVVLFFFYVYWIFKIKKFGGSTNLFFIYIFLLWFLYKNFIDKIFIFSHK